MLALHVPFEILEMTIAARAKTGFCPLCKARGFAPFLFEALVCLSDFVVSLSNLLLQSIALTT